MARCIFLASLLFVWVATECVSSADTSGWFPCGIYECEIDYTTATWWRADKSCRERSGYLASVITTDEQTAIRDKLNESSARQAWIGLSNFDRTPDQWRWVNGKTVNKEFWKTSYPRVHDEYGEYGLSEMCTVQTYDDGWENFNCGQALQYACKRSVNDSEPKPQPTPEPIVPGGCPLEYFSIDHPDMGNKCFRMVFVDKESDGLTLDDAVKQCRIGPGRRPDIASVHTPMEHALLTSRMQKLTYGLWIGLRHAGSQWLWVDNTVYDEEESNWAPGQPNSYLDDCAQIWYSQDQAGMWDDFRCNAQRGYVCQTFKDPDHQINTTHVPGTKCPDEAYTAYGDACYKLVTEPKSSWEEQRAACQGDSQGKFKSDLTSITHASENGELWTRALQYGNLTWIGFHDIKGSGEYSWADTSYAAYANWGTSRYETGHCAAMATDGKWYDHDCTAPLAAICKMTDKPPTVMPVRQNGSCPGESFGATDWRKHGSFCYLPKLNSYQAKTWLGAKLDCLRYDPDASLASIHDDVENDFIYKLMKCGFSLCTGWIGLFRHHKTNAFTWSDGSAESYKKWELGKPNNDVDEDVCVGMYFGEFNAKLWTDMGCYQSRPYICKVPQSAQVSPPPPHTKPCPDGWATFGAFCYKLHDTLATWWQTAEDRCREDGAHLPTITNKYQNDFLRKLVQEEIGLPVNTNPKIGFWTGLKKARKEKEYKWVATGQEYDPREFHRFSSKGPDYGNDNVDYCVEVVPGSGNNWESIVCDNGRPFFCELPLEEEGFSPMEVAGIVIGVIIALLLIVILVAYVLDRRGSINVRRKFDDAKRLIGFSNDAENSSPTPFVSEDSYPTP